MFILLFAFLILIYVHDLFLPPESTSRGFVRLQWFFICLFSGAKQLGSLLLIALFLIFVIFVTHIETLLKLLSKVLFLVLKLLGGELRWFWGRFFFVDVFCELSLPKDAELHLLSTSHYSSLRATFLIGRVG
jgi:hypothetical protein